MAIDSSTLPIHPGGEGSSAVSQQPKELAVDTVGNRFHVEWDPESPVTPLGQLVFFFQFLATGGMWQEFVKNCPLVFSSPNAPSIVNLLGTWLLSTLSGAWRYAHVTAIRGDQVNPPGLAMTKVISEDSLRRGFKNCDIKAVEQWQTKTLIETCRPFLERPWICDLDVTVKTLYGKQEGAEAGYNPHKKGRPSHAYHTLFIRHVRLALDVNVQPGNRHEPVHGRENFWRVWEALTPELRPWLVCGDANYGTEDYAAECEAKLQKYLFRVRISKPVQKMVLGLEKEGQWKTLSDIFSVRESELKLGKWSKKRRVIILRKRLEKQPKPSGLPLLEQGGLQLVTEPVYDYTVLVTNLPEPIESIANLYHNRCDMENSYDELKNQWGWGGFMTRDMKRCQVAARLNAIFFNWWSLFVRCAEPTKAREALTSRPLLLSAVGQVIKSGRQTTLRLTSTHGEREHAQSILTRLSIFLSGVVNTAEQLTMAERWRRVCAPIVAIFLAPQAMLPGPAG